jgi:selenocysteine lyase/cysteine desulfurase
MLKRILSLTDYLCRLLADRGLKVYSPRGEGEKSGIVCFDPGGAGAERVCADLLKRGFLTVPRRGNIHDFHLRRIKL